MTTITNDNFKELSASSAVMLIDFWATWCGPCRMLSPTVDEIAEEYAGRVTVAKCNVDDAGDIAMQYRVRNIPTLIFLKNGEMVDRTVGVVSKADIEAKLNALL